MEHIIVRWGPYTNTKQPERLNAVNDTLSNEIIQAISEASADDEVRVIVITGSGRGFCAGLDLTDYAKRSPDTQSLVIKN